MIQKLCELYLDTMCGTVQLRLELLNISKPKDKSKFELQFNLQSITNYNLQFNLFYFDIQIFQAKYYKVSQSIACILRVLSVGGDHQLESLDLFVACTANVIMQHIT